MHGGIISFALDTVGGLACMANNPGVDQVTIELTVNFLKPLKKEPFRAIGRELRSGRTTAVAEAEMTRWGGRALRDRAGDVVQDPEAPRRGVIVFLPLGDEDSRGKKSTLSNRWNLSSIRAALQ